MVVRSCRGFSGSALGSKGLGRSMEESGRALCVQLITPLVVVTVIYSVLALAVAISVVILVCPRGRFRSPKMRYRHAVGHLGLRGPARLQDQIEEGGSVVVGTKSIGALPAPAREGRQGAEAAAVSRGTTRSPPPPFLPGTRTSA